MVKEQKKVVEKKSSFLELAKERKTTLDFSMRKVSQQNLKKILEAGRWAPSVANMQPWNFIIIDKRKDIEKAMKSVVYGDFYTDPALLVGIVLVGDRSLYYDHYFKNLKDIRVLDSYMSVGMAAQNMCLMATELGISSCILSPDPVVFGKQIKVGKRDKVMLLVGFGYEAKSAFQKKKERMSLNDIISYGFLGGKQK